MKRRTVLRTLGLAVAVLLVVTLAAEILLTSWARRRLEEARARFESAGGSLDLSSYAPEEPASRRQNAAAWLEAGVDGLLLSDEERELVGHRFERLGETEGTEEPWTDDEVAAMEELLAYHRPAFQIMERAVDREGSSFGIEYRSGMEAEIPNLIPYLEASRTLVVASDLRLHQGRLDEALEHLRLLETLAAALRRESLVITMLVGNAVERLYLHQLHSFQKRVDDEATIERLLADVEHLDTVATSAARATAADGAMARAALHEVREEGVVERLLTGRWLPPLSMAHVLEAYAGLAESTTEPLAEVERLEDFEERWRPTRPVPWISPMADMLIPNLLDGFRREQTVLAARALARRSLQLRLEAVRSGGYPARLDDSPVSPYTGERAHWELREDGSRRLSFPETLEAWKEMESAHAINLAAPLVWELPPLE